MSTLCDGLAVEDMSSSAPDTTACGRFKDEKMARKLSAVEKVSVHLGLAVNVTAQLQKQMQVPQDIRLPAAESACLFVRSVRSRSRSSQITCEAEAGVESRSCAEYPQRKASTSRAVVAMSALASIRRLATRHACPVLDRCFRWRSIKAVAILQHGRTHVWS